MELLAELEKKHSWFLLLLCIDQVALERLQRKSN